MANTYMMYSIVSMSGRGEGSVEHEEVEPCPGLYHRVSDSSITDQDCHGEIPSVRQQRVGTRVWLGIVYTCNMRFHMAINPVSSRPVTPAAQIPS